MNDSQHKSILQMCCGAIMEQVDYEVTKAIDNILDPNTSPTAKRKINVTLELRPDDKRQVISLITSSKSVLAPTNPVVTSLYVIDKDTVVEMVPQVPGQLAFDGEEQEEPPVLKLIKLA